MSKIENLVKEYGSKKLKEIIEQQSSSYSEAFIDYAKDELIRRGETFKFNVELEKEVEAMSDNDLKNLVEKEWNDYHLEYLEIARKEYLKRNFKNKTENEEDPEQQEEKTIGKRYPALRTIAGIFSVFAWIIGIVAVIAAIISGSKGGEWGLMIALPAIVIGALIVLILLATAESIKVIIDIEENTRKNR
jgi:hypothetical protein